MFWSKKQDFDELYFVGVKSNHIELELINSKGKSKKLHLSLDRVSKSLPNNTITRSSIWHVLGIMPTSDRSKVLTALKKMALVYHPDCGGTSESFNTLKQARDKALAKCKS